MKQITLSMGAYMVRKIYRIIGVILLLAVTSLTYGQDAGYELAQSKLLSYDKLHDSTIIPKVRLQEALKGLEKEFNVSFMYKSGLLDDMHIVPATEFSDNFGIELEKLLNPLNLEYFQLNNRTFVITADPFAENYFLKSLKTIQHPVEGTVTDAGTGETLPGVNVLVKGTTTGTSTDADGEFDLMVPSLNDTLVFSFIGYQTQEVPIDGRTEIDVTLRPQAISSEEVVVVGYGTQRMEDITGSVSTVDVERTFESKPLTDPAKSLQGVVPGLTITYGNGGLTTSPTIRIRGIGSINGSSAPLILVDNVETPDLSYINPNDIKKDYGPEGCCFNLYLWGTGRIRGRLDHYKIRYQKATNYCHLLQ